MGHPDLTEVGDYLRGKLSWPQMEAIESHLDLCTSCRGLAEGQEGGDDSFVGCLRGLRPGADDPALPRLIEAAQALVLATVDHPRGRRNRRVAGCELLDEEGIPGGLGVVYKARHLLLEEVRAIKRPRTPDHAERAGLLARFRREVKAVGALRHDHVVRAHDAGEDEEGPYLVMEFLDGATLSALVKRGGPVPVPEACEMVRQAALGLQAAHERGMVHRDVKPGNLLLARGPGPARVVVIDWGLVRWAGAAPDDGAGELTRPGGAMGTPDYMAPEQGRDAQSVDTRADVYGLGTTLYFLLAGKPPFHDRPRAEKLVAHQRDPFPPLDRQRPDLPPALLGVLAGLTAKDPRQRTATPGEAAAALEPFCAGARLHALLDPDEAPTAPLPPASPRRRGPALALAAALLCGGLALAGWLSWPRPPRTGSPDGSVLGAGPAAPEAMRDDHPGPVTSLTFTPDGRRALAESGGGVICVWDLRNRYLEKSIPHTSMEAMPDRSGVLTLSADGKVMAVTGVIAGTKRKQFVSLFALPDCVRRWKDFSFADLDRAVALSPDGSRLAVGQLPGLLGVGELIGVKPRLVVEEVAGRRILYEPMRDAVSCLAFSPDGKHLAVGEGKVIRLRDLEGKRWAADFAGHTGAVEQVAFSPDGKRLLSASGIDRTLRVWSNDPADPARGRQMRETALDPAVRKYPCIAFDRHGRALTGSDDGRVSLWSLDSGRELIRFTHAGVAITAAAASPDGHHALAAGSDRQLRLYRLPAPDH